MELVKSNIENKIYTLRGLQVMLDSDLAELYHTETKIINRAVRRNANPFPVEFMFQLKVHERPISCCKKRGSGEPAVVSPHTICRR